MDLSRYSRARRASSYILEAAAAVAICYFVFRGANWSAGAWAIFTVVVAAIVVVRVLYDANAMSTREHLWWDLVFQFLAASVILLAGVWQQSLWLLVFGLLLAWFWLASWRAHRKLFPPSRVHEGE